VSSRTFRVANEQEFRALQAQIGLRGAADARPLAPAVDVKPRHRAQHSMCADQVVKISEDALQMSCFEWVDAMRPQHPILEWLVHIPNGGKRPRGVAGKLKAMGVKKGVLDVVLFLPYNGWSGLAIEMKVGKNVTTDDQDDWIEVLDAANYYTAVCYTLEEFITHMMRFLLGRCSRRPEEVEASLLAYLNSRRKGNQR
jgi:hypothetical protein